MFITRKRVPSKYQKLGCDCLVEIAIIEISLVEASAEKTNNEIKKEIFNGLSEGKACCPLVKKVENVSVTDSKSRFHQRLKKGS
jgi:hypothetical protein